MYYVYILECKDGSLYTGITTDVERRFKEHQEGVGSHYTKARKAKKIVYTEEVANRSLASKREVAIKKMSREQKKQLIADRVE
jgi:putative endonuclease